MHLPVQRINYSYDIICMENCVATDVRPNIFYLKDEYILTSALLPGPVATTVACRTLA